MCLADSDSPVESPTYTPADYDPEDDSLETQEEGIPIKQTAAPCQQSAEHLAETGEKKSGDPQDGFQHRQSRKSTLEAEQKDGGLF